METSQVVVYRLYGWGEGGGGAVKFTLDYIRGEVFLKIFKKSPFFIRNSMLKEC